MKEKLKFQDFNICPVDADTGDIAIALVQARWKC